MLRGSLLMSHAMISLLVVLWAAAAANAGGRSVGVAFHGEYHSSFISPPGHHKQYPWWSDFNHSAPNIFAKLLTPLRALAGGRPPAWTELSIVPSC